MRLVIVGGDAAGMSAATSVRRRDPDAEIIVVERGSHTSYSACGLPYFVAGEFSDASDLVVRTPSDFAQIGVDARIRLEAVAVDAQAATVRTRDVDSGKEREEPYDALLWAAGAQPVALGLPGLAQYGHPVQTLDDAEHLREHLVAPDVRSVVVVGAGYIGLEIAEALVGHGKNVTVIDRHLQVMASLDADMAAHVEAAMIGQGVKVSLGEPLVAVEGDGSRCRSVVTEAARYDADVVVLALGSRPNVAVPAAAGCAVGESGGLRVDAGMRTTVPGIWAAGDCVESRHLVGGHPVNVQLGTHANKQGKIAALTMTGEEAAFPGVVGTAVTRICDLEIARTGLSETEARSLGLDYVSETFVGTAKSGYLPDPGKVIVKMLAERRGGRVLGTQMVGSGNVAKRIDVAATWCQLALTVEDAQLLDLAYAPPFGSVWDLLQVGARKLTARLGRAPAL